jgi:hypothetical protein
VGDYDIWREAVQTRLAPRERRKIALKKFSPQATGGVWIQLYGGRESPFDSPCFRRLPGTESLPKYLLKTQDLEFC